MSLYISLHSNGTPPEHGGFFMGKRFECCRDATGRVFVEKKFFGLITVVYTEWLVMTNLLSNDITDEWHLEYELTKWSLS